MVSDVDDLNAFIVNGKIGIIAIDSYFAQVCPRIRVGVFRYQMRGLRTGDINNRKMVL